jgi:hypothetical protein
VSVGTILFRFEVVHDCIEGGQTDGVAWLMIVDGDVFSWDEVEV